MTSPRGPAAALVLAAGLWLAARPATLPAGPGPRGRGRPRSGPPRFSEIGQARRHPPGPGRLRIRPPRRPHLGLRARRRARSRSRPSGEGGRPSGGRRPSACRGAAVTRSRSSPTAGPPARPASTCRPPRPRHGRRGAASGRACAAGRGPTRTSTRPGSRPSSSVPTSVPLGPRSTTPWTTRSATSSSTISAWARTTRAGRTASR